MGDQLQEDQQQPWGVGGSQQEEGSQAEVQAAAWGVQGLETQHIERDPAPCHAICHLVIHILAWLKDDRSADPGPSEGGPPE